MVYKMYIFLESNIITCHQVKIAKRKTYTTYLRLNTEFVLKDYQTKSTLLEENTACNSLRVRIVLEK